MTLEAQTKVRITVWQPYFAGFMLAVEPNDSSALKILDEDTELQREVFTCSVEEDVWAGVTDDEKRTSLSTKFIDAFQPGLVPAQRDMAAFADFVEELRDVAFSPASEWSASTAGADESGAPSVRINGLLALYHQLAWLLDVFRDLPGASVSIR